MKQIFLSTLLVFSITGCVTGNDNQSSVEPEVTKQVSKIVDKKNAIKIQNPVPYMKGSTISKNIKNECKIGQQLSDFILSYSAEKGIGILHQNQVSKNTPGKTLVVEITNAVSTGNAWIGHRKYTSVKGTLYNNGKRKAGFTAARISGGGFFGGFKSSCSVLGRTVNTLGSDISIWLQNPTDNAHLGDNI